MRITGNTDLKGATIASTDKAVNDGKNSFATQSLTTSDIRNTSDYRAESQSMSAGGGYGGGKTSMNGTGVGFSNESGSASGTTTSGISGIAGNKTVRSDKDNSNALRKDWNGKELQQDVEAQARIMETFGKQAALGIGTLATGKLDALNKKIGKEIDPVKKAELEGEAKNWAEGGAYRTALHAAAGALGGGLAGAAGATASAVSMPAIAEQIGKMEAPEAVKQALAQVAAAALGAAVGGTAGLASAVNVEANNRQLHQTEKELAQKLAIQSKGKYTTAQIEEQMRGMTANINGKTEAGVADTAIGGKPTMDNGGTWIYAGTTADGKPIITQQLAPADAALRAFIVQNTTGSSVPSTITYAGSYSAPEYSNRPPLMSTAKCPSTGAECAAGIRNETQAQIDERRNNSADFFSTIGTQAGRVGATATAAGAIPGPHVLAAEALAISSSVINLGATVIQQILRPNAGALTADTLTTSIGEATAAIPGYGKILAPVVNEALETGKNSTWSTDYQNSLNEKLKK